MYIYKGRRVGTRGLQWLVIVDEDLVLMLAGKQPRVTRRTRLCATVEPYPLHIAI